MVLVVFCVFGNGCECTASFQEKNYDVLQRDHIHRRVSGSIMFFQNWEFSSSQHVRTCCYGLTCITDVVDKLTF